jgi:hypothetical protein
MRPSSAVCKNCISRVMIDANSVYGDVFSCYCIAIPATQPCPDIWIWRAAGAEYDDLAAKLAPSRYMARGFATFEQPWDGAGPLPANCPSCQKSLTTVGLIRDWPPRWKPVEGGSETACPWCPKLIRWRS